MVTSQRSWVKITRGSVAILFACVTLGCAKPKATQASLLVYTSPGGIRFVHIPAQTFRMGGVLDMWPVRPVKVASFWIAETELTNRDADRAIPQKRSKESSGDLQPMCGRSYQEVLNLIDKLSKLDKVPYKLPTEAQWECAARGGLDQAEYPWGNENPYGRSQIQSLATCNVKTFPPNAYGLYECSGNVSELVREPYRDLVFDPNSTYNPNGPNPMRLVKGGMYSQIYNPVAGRSSQPPEAEFCFDMGVRLMLEDGEAIRKAAKWESQASE